MRPAPPPSRLFIQTKTPGRNPGFLKKDSIFLIYLVSQINRYDNFILTGLNIRRRAAATNAIALLGTIIRRRRNAIGALRKTHDFAQFNAQLFRQPFSLIFSIVNRLFPRFIIQFFRLVKSKAQRTDLVGA